MSMFSPVNILLLSVILGSKSCESVPPNIIVILTDDMGFDLQCYGHPSQEKGPLDTMAEEGMRFTHWYSADSLCTPSRAALLTGRLPIRSGMVGPNRVLWQWDSGGLPKNEVTIAEHLSKYGYATGMVGKWHLGINEFSVNDGNHLPFHHGFQFVGTNFPYGQNWKCDPIKFSAEEMSEKCFKYRNMTMIQQPTTLENTTKEMVDDTKQFIIKNHDGPFFFYMSLLQTHTALFCAEEFCGKSKRGLYGDNVNEMSWAVGEVLDTLREQGIEKNTLLLFLSDHGPQPELCTEGGSSSIFKGGKASTWEGGIRVPAIAWWPGMIPAGTISDTIVSTLDIYPTLVNLARPNGDSGEKDGIQHDGQDITPVLTNQNSSSPHKFLFHYCSDRLMAVHYKSYKIHFVTQTITMNDSRLCTKGKPLDDVLSNLQCYGANVVEHDQPLIFNVDEDPGEQHPLDADSHRNLMDIVASGVEAHKASILPTPSQLGKKNEDLQPCCNPPKCTCNYSRGGNGNGNHADEL